METNEKQKNQETGGGFSETFGKIYGGVVEAAVLIILLLFPLYYRDYYYDILIAKYTFYYVMMLGFFGVLLLVSAAAVLIDGKECGFAHTKAFFAQFHPKNIRAHVQMSDWLLLGFLLTCVISTLQSDYVYESFWGNEGRFNGLFLHLLYGISFLIVSRCYRFKQWHLNAFLAVAMLPLLFGITDYFNMDLLGFKWEIDRTDRDSFMSTFGNINTFATYIGMVFGCLGVLLVKEESARKTALYAAGFAVTSMALMMCNSDNALLAVGLVFAVLPLIAFRTRRGTMGYTILLTIFFGMAQLTRWLTDAMADVVIRLGGACRMIVYLPGLWIFFLVFLALSALLGTAAMRKRSDGDYGKKFVRAWGVFLLVCVFAGLFVLYDANWGGNSARYGSLADYLHFSDEWGTYRGLAWRITLESYGKQSLLHRIWGFGLDTFGLMTVSYREYTSSICGQVFDSAHNEYLQYLVTVGPIGLAFYVAFLAAVICRMLRKSVDRTWGTAIALGVGCYLLQAVVTINLPIATPIMWMLLSVGAAGCRRRQESRT